MRSHSAIAIAAIVNVDELRQLNEGVFLRRHFRHLIPELGVVDVDVSWALNPVEDILGISYRTG